MSEIERLRKLEKEHEDVVDDLEGQIQDLEHLIWKKDCRIGELNDELSNLKGENFEVFTMNDEMKRDFITKNWDKITLENLESIVDNPMTI